MTATAMDDCASVYADLLARIRNPRTQASLERLKRALDHLVETHSTDFSVANVARAIAALYPGQGPKAQSIRNKPDGQTFQDLIAAYRRTHARAAEQPSRRSEEEEVVAAIRDQAIAVRVRDVYRERDELRRRNDWLKSEYGKLKAIDPRALLGAARPDAPTPEGAPEFAPHERKAARDFLENATELLECQWDERTGALLRPSGHTVAGRGFQHALRKLLGEEERLGQAQSSKALPPGSE